MKLFSLILILIFAITAQAETTYKQFQDIFAQGERPATIEDLKKIDTCYMSSEDAVNSVFEFKYKYQEKEVNYGPVIGMKKVDFFSFEWGIVNSFHFSEQTHEKVVKMGSLSFLQEDLSRETSGHFKFGYKGEDMVLAKLNLKFSAGRRNDDGVMLYGYDRFIGQCSLVKEEE